MDRERMNGEQIIDKNQSEDAFQKICMQNFMASMMGISNQKVKLVFWILNHLNSDNQLVMTQDAIAEKSGISIATVKETMKRLQGKEQEEIAFLIKINSGAYQVNPDIILKNT